LASWEAVSSEVPDKLMELGWWTPSRGTPLYRNSSPSYSRGGDLILKFLYAITVTLILVLVTIRLGRLAEQAKQRGLLDRLRE